MDKFLYKIDPQALIGKKILSEDDEEYVVEYAAFERNVKSGKKGNLIIFFANEKDAQKDSEHKQGLKQLKAELTKGNINFNGGKGEIWRVRYSKVVVKDSFLTIVSSDEERKDGFSCYTRSDNDSFGLMYDEGSDEDVETVEDVRNCVNCERGIIGGIRKLFKQQLGNEYTLALKEYYLEVAKENVQRTIKAEQEEFDALKISLDGLRKREEELYAEEGRKVFEDDDDEEELDSIDDGEREESVDEKDINDDDYGNDLQDGLLW